MEFLVGMTTRVPDGTADDAVNEVRAREAARTADLVAQGHVLRLWRPPLEPGEWRTLGLFDAADEEELAVIRASMPLSVWRTDEVSPLADHPNDPGRGAVRLDPGSSEFLTTMTAVVPPGTLPDAVDRAYADEQERARELAERAHLLRLWALPQQRTTLGHWQVRDAAQLDDILNALPLAAWLTIDTVPLTRHPSDPGG
jgi:muconolactone delta-isomerase